MLRINRLLIIAALCVGAPALGRANETYRYTENIDNTMRFSGAETDEWILLELDPHLASGGYGHGGVLVWSPAGELLATGGQTASLLLFD